VGVAVWWLPYFLDRERHICSEECRIQESGSRIKKEGCSGILLKRFEGSREF